MHILSNISRNKNNEMTMKFGQLMEYNKRNIFFKNHEENETEKLDPDILLFLKKALYEVQASGLQF